MRLTRLSDAVINAVCTAAFASAVLIAARILANAVRTLG